LELIQTAVWGLVTGVVGIVTGRREERVEPQPKRLFQHERNETSQQIAAQFQTGVRVDFDEVHTQIFIDHEIQSEDFKVVEPSRGVQRDEGRAHSIFGEISHLGVDLIYLEILSGSSL
jgi:hypothetical protein